MSKETKAGIPGEALIRLEENGIIKQDDPDIPACSVCQHNGFAELTGKAASVKALRPEPGIEFKSFTDFPRGTMYDILKDAYSYDERNGRLWDTNWRESDSFFYDHPEIADKYGLVTCLDGKPIGFVCWDPRNRPDYVEIGHNGILQKYKGRGYGRLQLEEALRRIREYEGLKRIIVCTNSNLIAPKNYEAAGFILYDRKPNETESAYTGDYLYYEIVL